jgi:outer membrane protein assembly factor BamB
VGQFNSTLSSWFAGDLPLAPWRAYLPHMTPLAALARSVRWSLLGAVLAAAGALNLHAENWGHWRGPQFNGVSPETGLPATFSKTNGIQWVAELPGAAAATPIIWGDHVFVSSTDRQAKTLVARALDRRSGKTLWQQEVSPAYQKDDKSNYASPSPVTDGQVVVFLFGNGNLAAFDPAGQRLWARNLERDYGPWAYQWTYGASPTIYDGKLFVQVLQRNTAVNGHGRTDGPNESYVLALEPKTGRELWRHVRPTEAHQEAQEAYSTPIPCEAGGVRQLLIVGGDCLSGHDLATGRELWRWGTWNPARIGHWRLVPSAVVGDGVALACAPKGSPVYAVKLGGKGTLDDSCLAWKSEPQSASSDVATPLFYQGRFYILNGEKQKLARLDPATGRVEWSGDLGVRSKIESSPTGADGRLYFMNFRGDVFIVEAGPEFKAPQVIPMGDAGDDAIRSSIAVSQGHLFIRTTRKLYCIGR